MQSTQNRLPRRALARGRGLPDENATSRTKAFNIASGPVLGPSKIPVKDSTTLKARPALGEVTYTSINLRRQPAKDDDPKRTRAGSISNTRPELPLKQQRVVSGTTRAQPVVVEEIEELDVQLNDVRMNDDQIDALDEPMTDDHAPPQPTSSRPTSRHAPVWPELSPGSQSRADKILRQVRHDLEGIDTYDPYETTMCSEYAHEIFTYMKSLEDSIMPLPDYIKCQSDFDWTTRMKLVDWMASIHSKYHLMPETLWIAVNIVDRFLSKRVVTIVKLQLVGVTALFIASKYEEIMAPGVEEFVMLVEHQYSKEEIFKGERILLETLEFNISSYCSPYTWMRRISKADQYELQTRTLGKFLSELTLLDHRFLRASPHLVAAVAMYSARVMLNADWDAAFVYFSDYTEEQLREGHRMLCERIAARDFTKLFVCKKYANRRYLKASIYALQWVKVAQSGVGAVQAMDAYEA
ncbi:cyclin-like protein [Flagelloscypha sp. PMI_526]|nr:cyclin-like protein [Flagelloscypha sp. PMI_526]